MEKYQFGFGCMRLPLLNADDVASFDFSNSPPLIATVTVTPTSISITIIVIILNFFISKFFAFKK